MSKKGYYIGTAIAGGLVGALAGLLLAPAPGRETRRRLRRQIAEGRDELLRRGNRAVGDVSGFLYSQFEESKRKLANVVNG
jgi:gas vesicle protein